MSVAVKEQERFHFLDGLRGIAALLVVVHHAFTSNIVKFINGIGFPSAGFFFAEFTQSGVELFFVLSGVVLLRPYLRRQRPFKTGNYFARRLKRIYPPYFFALLFAGFVVWFNNHFATWYNVRGLHVNFSWAQMFKHLFIINLDHVYYNIAWWSLGIEILFYMVVPVVVFTFPSVDKLTARRIITTILIIQIALIAGAYWFTQSFSTIYNYLAPGVNIGRAPEYAICFLTGIFIAAKDFSLQYARSFLLSGIAIVFAALVLFKISPVYISVLHTGYALVYGGLIIYAFRPGGFRSILSKPIMIWLGERSYSLFLIHFSVFYLMNNIVSHFTPDRNIYYGIFTRGLCIPIALFMAMLLFHFVERKFTRGLVTDKYFWPWQVGRLHLKEQAGKAADAKVNDTLAVETV